MRNTTKPRKVTPRMARSTDVSRLSFPLQVVIAIVASILSAASVVWINQSGIKESQAQIQSDVRNIITMMNEREKTSAAEAKTRDTLILSETNRLTEKITALEKKLDEVDRSSKLADYDLKALIGKR